MLPCPPHLASLPYISAPLCPSLLPLLHHAHASRRNPPPLAHCSLGPSPPFHTFIAQIKEEGLTHVDSHLAALLLLSLIAYSDGLMLDGSVGAAAVVEIIGMDGSVKKTRVLGSQQTVWAGGGEGVHLSLTTAISLLHAHAHSPALTLLIDYEALVSSPISALPLPGQSI